MNDDGEASSHEAYDGYFKYDRKVAETYDSDRKVEAHWWHEDRCVREFVGGRRIRSLLDLPVGTGRFFPHYLGIESVVGVDISDEMLAEARKSAMATGGAIKLERGDVFRLTYADESFDVTIVSRLLHLIPPQMLGGAIKELSRVTKEELLVQSYVPMGKRFGTPLRLRSRLRNRLNALLSPIKPPPKIGDEPWSHIQSYAHKQVLINALFEAFGFVASKSHVIDIYGAQEVRATVFKRLR